MGWVRKSCIPKHYLCLRKQNSNPAYDYFIVIEKDRLAEAPRLFYDFTMTLRTAAEKEIVAEIGIGHPRHQIDHPELFSKCKAVVHDHVKRVHSADRERRQRQVLNED